MNTIASSKESLPSQIDRNQWLLAELMDGYLEQLERGESLSVSTLCRAHPEIADEIRRFAKSLDEIHQAVQIPSLQEESNERSRLSRVIGDYQILREVGRGGMGVVYEAKQLSLERRVALKILPFAAVLDQRQIARFQNEAQAAAQLHHPNIVPVYAIGNDRGTYFYSMQFIDGQSLEEAIRQLRHEGQLSDSLRLAPTQAMPSTVDSATNAITCPSKMHRRTDKGGATTVRSVRSPIHRSRIVEIGIQVAQALHHAHEHGIVHRDVKPSNLLIDPTGKVWVADFGLAQCASLQSLTQTGDMLGTLRYMSPEQAAGKSTWIDHRSDIYSLGATLYELLMLRPLVTATDRAEMLRQVTAEQKHSIRQWNPDIPIDFETVILKAIAHDREQRYSSAQEFAEDLQRIANGRSPLAKRPTHWEQIRRWVSKHALLFAVASVVLLFLLSASLAAFSWVERKREQVISANRLALQHLAIANTVVDEFGTQLIERLNSIPRTNSLQEEIAEKTIEYLTAFSVYASKDPEQRNEVTRAHMRLAKLYENQGDREHAVQAYAEAEDRLLHDSSSQNADLRMMRTTCINNFACLLTSMGRFDEAANKLQSELARIDRLDAEVSTESMDAFRQSLLRLNLSQVERGRGATNASDRALRQAIDNLQALAGAHKESMTLSAVTTSPASSEVGEILITAILQLASEARSPQSVRQTLLPIAIQLAQRISTARPGDPLALHQVSVCKLALASQFRYQSMNEESLEWLRQANNELQSLIRSYPEIPKFQIDAASACNNLGRTYIDLGKLELADQPLAQARRIVEPLADLSQDYTAISNLGGILHNQAILAEQRHQWSEAYQLLEDAVELQNKALSQAPDSQRARRFLDEHQHCLDRVASRIDPHQKHARMP